MTPPGGGIHHVTAICGDPRRNLAFYRGVLGLQLVKRTVNFDDPSTLHLYYGDAEGRPGSLITFFAWPGANPGRAGAGRVGEVAFAVPLSAIGFWIGRLIARGIGFVGPAARATSGGVERVISFRDPDGLPLAIVGTAAAPAAVTAGGEIAADDAIRGLHGITLWVERAEPTAAILEAELGLRTASVDGETRRMMAGSGGPGAIAEVRAIGGFPAGVDGPGAVHHVAWRVPDDAGQIAIRERLLGAGFEPTPVLDRHYFRSVYFREPGGVLFEIATDGPGFGIDEPPDRLGARLMLPPRLEPLRGTIEPSLPPIED